MTNAPTSEDFTNILDLISNMPTPEQSSANDTRVIANMGLDMLDNERERIAAAMDIAAEDAMRYRALCTTIALRQWARKIRENDL